MNDTDTAIAKAAKDLQSALTNAGGDYRVDVNRIDLTSIADAEKRFEYVVHVTEMDERTIV